MEDPFESFKKWHNSNELSKRSHPKRKKAEPKDRQKSKMIRRLRRRTRYLADEEEHLLNLKQKATAAFHASINEYCQNNPNAENPLRPVDVKSKKEKQTDTAWSDEIKSLYREIALLTHPDKQHEDPEEMLDFFRTATTAKEDNKLEDLVNISFDLEIDISNISMDLVEEIEKNLDKKEIKIVEIRKDAAIFWFKANKETQQSMIKQMCPIKKDKNN